SNDVITRVVCPVPAKAFNIIITVPARIAYVILSRVLYGRVPGKDQSRAAWPVSILAAVDPIIIVIYAKPPAIGRPASGISLPQMDRQTTGTRPIGISRPYEGGRDATCDLIYDHGTYGGSGGQ